VKQDLIKETILRETERMFLKIILDMLKKDFVLTGKNWNKCSKVRNNFCELVPVN